MSDLTNAARRAISDFERGNLHGRNPSPWPIIRWLKILIDDIENGGEK